MMDDRSFEALVRDALGRPGEPAPFTIDVVERVMARVAGEGPPPRREVGVVQFWRWAAAAAVVGLALLAVVAWRGPTLEGLASSLGLGAAAAANAAAKLVEPASAIASALGRVMTALAGSARTLLQPLAAFQPLARVLLVVVTAGMLGVTTFIVGRDVRARAIE